MVGISRRSALAGLFGMGALSVSGVWSAPARALAHVSLPSGPMRLSRVVERSLVDGASIRVERIWDLTFASQSQGISVTGVQIEAQVDAPSNLASIAEIERERSTDSMWPILLGEDGAIMAASSGTREEDLSAALREAERMISARDIPAPSIAQQRTYLARLQQASSSLLDQLPRDLFYPTGLPIRSYEEMELPGGIKGSFELTYEANKVPEHGWLDRAIRRVVTHVGESENSATERWALREI